MHITRSAKAAIALATSVWVLASACTPSADPAGVASSGAQASGTIEFWHFFTDREAAAIDEIVADFRAEHPGVTVVVKNGQDDAKMLQAIGAGQGPDVALSYSTDVVGKFCSSGALIDLNPYLQRDNVDLTRYPEVIRSYTEFADKRCVMPFLADVYGLYYNKDIFAEAGITGPPQTLDELTDLAKKLTVRSADGTIERAGFLPLFGFYENSPSHFAPMTGATWLKEDGTSAIGGDPKWEKLIVWQRELVDWYGYEQLEKFRASLGDEWSADNAFHKGKVAMNVDGEWRMAFLRDQAPEVDFGVAPVPVDDPGRYGSGYVTGNIIGISRNSDNPEAAWAFIRYLTTETPAIVKLSNGIRNVPSTTDALSSPDLDDDDAFQVFLDIFAHPDTGTTPPSAIGAAYQDEFSAFLEAHQSGQEADLAAGLAKVDSQINNLLKLAG